MHTKECSSDFKKLSVDQPPHYNKYKVPCIDIAESMNFNLGNALKYIWRCEEKFNKIEDLEKAIWYIQREINRDRESKEN